MRAFSGAAKDNTKDAEYDGVNDSSYLEMTFRSTASTTDSSTVRDDHSLEDYFDVDGGSDLMRERKDPPVLSLVKAYLETNGGLKSVKHDDVLSTKHRDDLVEVTSGGLKRLPSADDVSLDDSNELGDSVVRLGISHQLTSNQTMSSESSKDMTASEPDVSETDSPRLSSKLRHHLVNNTDSNNASMVSLELNGADMMTKALITASPLAARASKDDKKTSKLAVSLVKRTSSRERRVQRSLEHQLQLSPAPSSSSSSEFLPTSSGRFSSSSSSSLPTRNGSIIGELKGSSRPNSFIAATVAGEEESSIMNPLRRLKVSSSFNKARTKLGLRSSSDKVFRSGTTMPLANFNANPSFFDRLREQELENAQLESMQVQNTKSFSGGSPNDDLLKSGSVKGKSTGIVLPSRSPPKLSKRSTKLCERKFHADQITASGEKIATDDFCSSPFFSPIHIEESVESDFVQLRSHESHSSSHGSERSSTTQPSDDGVCTDDSGLASLGGRNDILKLVSIISDGSTAEPSQISNGAGKLSAAELGIGNDSDSFWMKKVDFDKPVTDSIGSGFPSLVRKDNTCYEDLLECALDVEQERYL